MPLQAYFRINAENMGQFERTLIIADEGSKVHYIEGCSAPTYTSDSLHSAVVEIIVKPSARVTYTTIQNWSDNVFNLVTKARLRGSRRSHGVDRRQHRLEADHEVPGGGARRSESLGRSSVRRLRGAQPASRHRRQDDPRGTGRPPPRSSQSRFPKTGAAPRIGGWCESKTMPMAAKAMCSVMLSSSTRIPSPTPTPIWRSGSGDAIIGHEATVSRVADEQLFYLQSRGLTEEQAMGMIVNGFIEPRHTHPLPMEYAVEWSRLIELQMGGQCRLTRSVG